MTQCNMVNANSSNSQLNKLKLAAKSYTEITLRISPNMIGNSNDETKFWHKLLLTEKQVVRLRNGFYK